MFVFPFSRYQADWQRSRDADLGRQPALHRHWGLIGEPATKWRSNAEVGYGLPAGRFVGTPSVGVGTSQYGRDYRFGYRLGLLERGALDFDLKVSGTRRESAMTPEPDPAACRIIRVVGESMEPTLPDGSAILIHVGSTERRDSKIFVVQIGDELIVKRLLNDPKAGWLLFSDNPDKTAWPTRPWPDDAAIVGEVKWLGRTFT